MNRHIKCSICEKTVDKNAAGLNKKLLGRNSKNLLCMDCLATHIDISADELYEKIEEFKDQGCTLFS